MKIKIFFLLSLMVVSSGLTMKLAGKDHTFNLGEATTAKSTSKIGVEHNKGAQGYHDIMANLPVGGSDKDTSTITFSLKEKQKAGFSCSTFVESKVKWVLSGAASASGTGAYAKGNKVNWSSQYTLNPGTYQVKISEVSPPPGNKQKTAYNVSFVIAIQPVEKEKPKSSEVKKTEEKTKTTSKKPEPKATPPVAESNKKQQSSTPQKTDTQKSTPKQAPVTAPSPMTVPYQAAKQPAPPVSTPDEAPVDWKQIIQDKIASQIDATKDFVSERTKDIRSFFETDDMKLDDVPVPNIKYYRQYKSPEEQSWARRNLFSWLGAPYTEAYDEHGGSAFWRHKGPNDSGEIYIYAEQKKLEDMKFDAAHELSHVFMDAMINRKCGVNSGKKVPKWYTEGLAELGAIEIAYEGTLYHERDSIIFLKELTDKDDPENILRYAMTNWDSKIYRNEDKDPNGVYKEAKYAAAGTFLKHIHDNYGGKETVNAILEDAAKGYRIDNAILKHTQNYMGSKTSAIKEFQKESSSMTLGQLEKSVKGTCSSVTMDQLITDWKNNLNRKYFENISP